MEEYRITDDATAAESNPAGLTLLTRREASVHLRTTSTETEALDPFTDNIFDPTKSFGDSVVSPSFLDGGFLNESIFEFDSQLDVVGFSGAVRLGSFLSIGASVRYTRLDFELVNQYLEFPRGEFIEPTALLLVENVDDSDEELTFNAGILINPNGKLSLGLVYKQGADFTLDASQALAFVSEDDVDVRGDGMPMPASFAVPGVWGAGLAYRPNSSWVIGLDVVKVEYSDIQATRFSGDPESGDPDGPDDETEIHLGFEYGFTVGSKKIPVFLRAGVYNRITTPTPRSIQSRSS